MISVLQIIKEQLVNIHLIFRLSVYEIRGKYLMHYLGVVWQFLNPAIQISVYWLIFGLGIRSGGEVNGFPFFTFLIVGIIPWFFINPTINQGSNSVYKQVRLVSKMKFPISILPSVSIVSNLFNFIVMTLIMAVILHFKGIEPSIYLIQYPYYVFCMIVFLYATTLLFSTISTIVRDFQSLLQSTLRILFYLSPILWDIKMMPAFFDPIVKLNPIYYIIDGFRNTFLYQKWFFADLNIMFYFWVVTLLMLFVGAALHMKFRKKFIDYL
ncbi:ABC transporter permease [Rossellomorea marisflavi]|uniref:ABC transporter permease n=1 Tax=Rossellomorea marisflavi TaxID=189381 RepID=UPI0006F6AE14|nr:ABC transporter permease [Rossellomorea marisflavi]KQU58365.1 Teichoic acid translocation permease TagG [Bacillus sp. Leaf406]MBV6685739.1 ABC transporter permease [Bacillus sp. JRC01]MDW4528391.1 ABC transporter permease [Rossellomorea marisflavi]